MHGSPDDIPPHCIIDGEGLINALVKLVSEANDDALVVSSFITAVSASSDKSNISARLHVYVWYCIVLFSVILHL